MAILSNIKVLWITIIILILLAGAVTLNLGVFINAVISFLIVAFAVFLVVKGMNKMQKEEAPPPPDTKECPFCFSTIPIQASRCPHCTSELAPAAAPTS